MFLRYILQFDLNNSRQKLYKMSIVKHMLVAVAGLPENQTGSRTQKDKKNFHDILQILVV